MNEVEVDEAIVICMYGPFFAVARSIDTPSNPFALLLFQARLISPKAVAEEVRDIGATGAVVVAHTIVDASPALTKLTIARAE